MFAFLKIFDMVPGWVWAAMVLVATLAACAESNSHKTTKLKMAEYEVLVGKLEVAREKAVREAEESNRKVETLRNTRAQEIDHVIREEQRATANLVRDAAATRSMLISATAALTTLGGSATVDPKALARAEEGAAALGQLLGTCDQVAEDLGRDVEDLASQVRGLLQRYDSLGQGLAGKEDLFLFTGNPFTYGSQVDPGLTSWRHVVVSTPLPMVSAQTLGDRDLRFDRK